MPVERKHSAMVSGPRDSAALDRIPLGPEREKNMVTYWQLTGGLVSDILLHSRVFTNCQKIRNECLWVMSGLQNTLQEFFFNKRSCTDSIKMAKE